MAMKERIFLVSIIVILIIGIVSIINIYENRLLKEQSMVVDGKKNKLKYTVNEIKTLIKALPNYQGDSITIFEDGSIKSSIPELDGGLANAQQPNETKQYLEGIARNEKLPLAYIIYKHIVPYYIEEKERNKKKN